MPGAVPPQLPQSEAKLNNPAWPRAVKSQEIHGKLSLGVVCLAALLWQGLTDTCMISRWKVPLQAFHLILE